MECARCDGTGFEQFEREATIADLDDMQFQFLLEATRVREGTDEATQNKQQLQQQSGGGMIPSSAPGVPSNF